MMLIREAIGPELAKAPKDQVPVIERVVHTTADPEFAKLLVISEDAVKSGVAAIKAGAKVVTDVKMVKAGINEARLKKFGGKVTTYMNDERTMDMAKCRVINSFSSCDETCNKRRFRWRYHTHW